MVNSQKVIVKDMRSRLLAANREPDEAYMKRRKNLQEVSRLKMNIKAMLEEDRGDATGCVDNNDGGSKRSRDASQV
jgi:predicted transcriptional regulator